jgi:DNA repair protein RadA/Sms
MAKNTTTSFVCSSCGYDSTKWYGKCPECGEWNTMREFKLAQTKNSKLKTQNLSSQSSISPRKISEVKISSTSRISTGFSEFDRVLGSEKTAGIVPGSAILLSGDPGIGKSTILLQTAINLSSDNKILYVTGEESEAQIALRAERLSKTKKNLNLFILAASNIDAALESANKGSFDLVIIDSIQTMESTDLPGYSGSIPQVRYATGRLVKFAKETGIPVIIIGHVTKEGMVAGPQMLSHMVDTVLYLEGEKLTGVRILRAFKNRFGDTSEVGIFAMEENGLKEIVDLSDLFLGEKVSSPGSCVAVVMEGSRPILAEIQALSINSNLPYPRRVASGISEKRLELLLAILQKHCRLPLDRFDIFVNVVGGFKITETASDLAVCLAIVSSFKGKPLNKTAAVAEVGLLGELKKVIFADKRLKEAKKFGFKLVSYESAKTLPQLLLNLFK